MKRTARPEKRRALYARDDWRCAYCGWWGGEAPERLTLDHLHPRADGGSNRSHNLVTACAGCNEQRGRRPLAAWLALLPSDTVARALEVLATALRGALSREAHLLRQDVAAERRARAERRMGSLDG